MLIKHTFDVYKYLFLNGTFRHIHGSENKVVSWKKFECLSEQMLQGRAVILASPKMTGFSQTV